MDLKALVSKFLMKAWQNPPKAGEELSRVVVLHMGSTKEQEVYSRDVDSKAFSPEGAAFEIVEACQEDAEGIGGLQKYAIRAYHGARKTPTVKRIAIDARPDTVDDEFSEPANQKGVLSQMMRHTEAATRLAIGGAHENQRVMLKTIERLQTRIEFLENERAKSWELIESMKTQEHERELERVLIERAEKRKDDAMGELKLLLPVVAQKLNLPVLGSGAPSDQANAAGLMLMIAKLMDSMKPDQIAKLMGIFDTAQQAAFGSLLQELNKAKTKAS